MITTEQVDHMIGARVYDSAGEKIGSVGQVYLDERDGHPAWVAVRTGLFGMNESFVPLDRGARFDGGDLHVSVGKEVVKDAPQVEPESGNLSEHSATELYKYYNMPDGKWATGRDTQDRQKTLSGNVGTPKVTTTGASTGKADQRGRNLNLTRYEEQLRVGKEQVETGKVRLRKHVVTEDVTMTVPVSHEEVRIEREPVAGTASRGTLDEPAFGEETAEVTLHAEKPVVSKETVAVEKVGLTKETRTEQQPVKGTVRKEQIDIEDERDVSKRKR